MDIECAEMKDIFRKLTRSPLVPFPARGGRLDAPDHQGVYLIFGRNEEVLHVGRTIRGSRGLLQRLQNHLDGRSSFVKSYMKPRHKDIRIGHRFRYVEVESPRMRALLESYATGMLCP